MKKTLVLIGLFFSLSLLVAQKDYAPNDHYHYRLAMAAIDESNYDKAYDCLDSELKQYPQNGHAWYWAALIYIHREEAESAKTALSYALSYLPKKDKAYRSSSYRVLGSVFESEENYSVALSAYNKAIKILPKDYRNYEARGNLYCTLDLYGRALEDYFSAINCDESAGDSYLGAAVCFFIKDATESAYKCINAGIRACPSNSNLYSARALFYLKDEMYDNATEDVVTALKIDYNDKAFDLLEPLAQKNYSNLVAKLTLEQNSDKTNAAWPYYLGTVHNAAHNHPKALSSFYTVYGINPDLALQPLSQCWKSVGDYNTALKYINEAIEQDSSALNLYRRALLYDALGYTDLAYKDCNNAIEFNPKFIEGYYLKAWINNLSNDYDEGIANLDIVISFNPDIETYTRRGIAYQEKGMQKQALKDFKNAIALDTIPDENIYAIFAYYYSGEISKGENKLNLILDKNSKGSSDDFDYYYPACFYALTNQHDKAIEYLRKLFESGYRDFRNLERDHGFNNIRSNEDYIALVDEYKAKMNQQIQQLHKQFGISENDSQTDNYIEKTQEIHFTKRGGVCEVPCTINDLPLYFIFDTGASDVSISTVEATFMLKNKYLTSADITGKQNYMNANGEISEGTIINLKTVKFGDAVLNNVRASVVKSQTAPLLLGQSVLERLGKIEIDNEKRVLRITYKEKINK